MPVTTIDPGALRHELFLDVCTTTPDGMGGHAEVWTEIASVFGMVEPVSATARFGAGQTREDVTHRITLRWRDDVASGMRLIRQGRIFEILTVHDPDETQRYLACRTREVGL